MPYKHPASQLGKSRLCPCVAPCWTTSHKNKGWKSATCKNIAQQSGTDKRAHVRYLRWPLLDTNTKCLLSCGGALRPPAVTHIPRGAQRLLAAPPSCPGGSGTRAKWQRVSCTPWRPRRSMKLTARMWAAGSRLCVASLGAQGWAAGSEQSPPRKTSSSFLGEGLARAGNQQTSAGLAQVHKAKG